MHLWMSFHVFPTASEKKDYPNKNDASLPPQLCSACFCSCWITDETFFYSLNLTYFTTVFLFNSAIFMVVASRIWKMQKVLKPNSRIRAECEGKSQGDNHRRFSDACQSIITLIGLTCLLGTSWGLAFLGSGHVNYPILYLFCILNSLQGGSVVKCGLHVLTESLLVSIVRFLWGLLYFIWDSLCCSYLTLSQFIFFFLFQRLFYLPVDLPLNQETKEEGNGGETLNSCEDFRD